MTRVDIHHDRILIIDFGGQTTQLIARRVRESGVYCEIHPWDVHAKTVSDFAPSGVIFSGGPESTIVDGSPFIQDNLLALDVPMLGICYGMQALVNQLGGRVEAHRGESEFGYAAMDVVGECALFDQLNDSTNASPQLDVWMSHGDRVAALPPNYVCVGRSDNAQQRFGIQFHPEVTHTKQGAELLRRFVIDVCGCSGQWTSGNIIQNAIDDARAKVGDERVLLALSGGVDSSVVAALLHQAIGQQLTCVFVDHGLLRLNEGDQVMGQR